MSELASEPVSQRPREAPVAVVTGAGSGLGRVVAGALLDAGYRVALAGRRADALAETAAGREHVLVPVIEGLGRTLERVEITELRDGVFRADLVFDSGTRIAARPSDVLAVAVREGLPIAVADTIMDEVGQPIADLFPGGADAPPEQQLQDFHAFLEDVSPEDFDR